MRATLTRLTRARSLRGMRGNTCVLLQDDFAVGLTGKFARELFDLFGDGRIREQAHGQAIAVGIAACSFFSGVRAWTGTSAGIAPVCRNLPLGGHGSGRLLTAWIFEPNYRISFDDPA